MNKITKIIWVIIAILILLMIISYVSDYLIQSDNPLRGLVNLILLVPTALLIIFNLGYTERQLVSKYPRGRDRGALEFKQLQLL